MKNCNIAILGATGAVGREMLNVLEEYDIPVSRLKLLSSARSAGSKIPFRGEDLTVEEATDVPGRAGILRPTAATSAMPSCTRTSSGRQVF